MRIEMAKGTKARDLKPGQEILLSTGFGHYYPVTVVSVDRAVDLADRWIRVLAHAKTRRAQLEAAKIVVTALDDGFDICGREARIVEVKKDGRTSLRAFAANEEVRVA